MESPDFFRNSFGVAIQLRFLPGDRIINHSLRSIGALESVAGVLMCGLCQLLLAIVHRLVVLEDPGLVDPQASGSHRTPEISPIAGNTKTTETTAPADVSPAFW
jgi:hypothetical protein